MKNIILLAAIVGVVLVSGCKKEDSNCKELTTVAPGSEIEALEQYISSNKIEATKDTRGFFYKIETTGNNKHPDICTQVSVNYKGTLTNGAIFDQASNVSFNLSNLIKGWQAGIPLIGEGGKITLYLPPSMGYGSSAVNGIPANSILIFTIDLVKVN